MLRVFSDGLKWKPCNGRTWLARSQAVARANGDEHELDAVSHIRTESVVVPASAFPPGQTAAAAEKVTLRERERVSYAADAPAQRRQLGLETSLFPAAPEAEVRIRTVPGGILFQFPGQIEDAFCGANRVLMAPNDQ